MSCQRIGAVGRLSPPPPKIEKTTINVSATVPLEFCVGLREEAHRRGISIDTLVSQILCEYGAKIYRSKSKRRKKIAE